MSNPKLKVVGKVIKANEIVKHLNDIDVVILLNETIFDQLEEEQKMIVAEELVAEIFYDSEKDVLKLIKPDLVTFSGVVAKYGYEKYMRKKESVASLFQSESEKGA